MYYNQFSRYFTCMYIIKGGNAPQVLGMDYKSKRCLCRLFNPPQASLLLRDEDDRSPNLPSATSEECNDNDCNYLLSNHHNFFESFKEPSSSETLTATPGL